MKITPADITVETVYDPEAEMERCPVCGFETNGYPPGSVHTLQICLLWLMERIKKLEAK